MHPSQRFQAPHSIPTGSALADILNRELVDLLAESLADVVPDFSLTDFRHQALHGLEDLALTPRAQHLAHAMAAQFPHAVADALPVFEQCLGPVLQVTEGYGLAPFYYLPHSHMLAAWFAADGPARKQDLTAGLHACFVLTQRFTAEFCLRPLIERDQGAVLATLATWVSDPSPHVRRLVSEGTRPRLPWASRLRALQADPAPVLPLLDALVADDERYVRRSVANHLGDIAKDHRELALDQVETWLTDAEGNDAERRKRVHEVVRHALRHPTKLGNARAIELRTRAGWKPRRK